MTRMFLYHIILHPLTHGDRPTGRAVASAAQASTLCPNLSLALVAGLAPCRPESAPGGKRISLQNMPLLAEGPVQTLPLVADGPAQNIYCVY